MIYSFCYNTYSGEKNMKTIKFSALLLIAFLFMSLNCLHAEEDLRVSVLRSEPLGYIGSDGKPTGTHWNYIQAIAKRSGIPMTASLEPKARLFKNLKLGKTDAAIVFRAKKRDKIVKYAGKIRAIKFAALNLKENPLNNYADLSKSEKIGVIKGTLVSKRFDADTSLNKYPVVDYNTMIKMFQRKRITTLTGNAIVLSYMLNKHNAQNLIQKPALKLTVKEQWFHMSNKSKHLDKLGKISAAIKSLTADGTFDRILTESVGEGWQQINH